MVDEYVVRYVGNGLREEAEREEEIINDLIRERNELNNEIAKMQKRKDEIASILRSVGIR